jgi:hypothetical protein
MISAAMGVPEPASITIVLVVLMWASVAQQHGATAGSIK